MNNPTFVHGILYTHAIVNAKANTVAKRSNFQPLETTPFIGSGYYSMNTYSDQNCNNLAIGEMSCLVHTYTLPSAGSLLF
jgi:hypothetical protein